jgi:hypothetical protein
METQTTQRTMNMTKILMAAVATMVTISSLSIIPAKASVDGFSTAVVNTQIVERRKPRVKGGSGCDDPRDVIEHPECR